MPSTTNLVPNNAPPLTHSDGSQSKLLIPASPGTDLWRKPPSLDISNAPNYVYNFPTSEFHSARVTFSAEWTRQYDQGGLVLSLPAFTPARSPNALWVKTGVEFYEGKRHISVVAARDAADWSLLPVLADQGKTVTLEIEREEIDATKGRGSSLWVYIVEGEKRTAIREVTWVFKEQRDMAGHISIGVYAARPTKEGPADTEQLIVNFQDLSVR